MQKERKRLLDEWARIIMVSAHGGILTGDASKPIMINEVYAVNGPRVGALELHAGLMAGDLMRILKRDDCATLCQFVPWRFSGQPICYLSSRFVRVEAGWPDSLAERDIRLSDLGQWPKDGGRWIAGRNEWGRTITLGLHDQCPHWLVAGQTGSGKSWGMRAAVGQLCLDPENHLVLIDGKFGEGLGPLAHVSGLVGPLARDVEDARAALSWCVGELRRRFENPNGHRRLIIVVDELQTFTSDKVCRDYLRRLVSQGRAAKVHVIMGTQDPIKAAFRDNTIKRNLPGHIALRVEDYKASEVAVGGNTPRADWLLGAGDSYCITPAACHRAQLADRKSAQFGELSTGEPLYEQWPDLDPEAGGTLPENMVNWGYTGQELGAAILAAQREFGRRRMTTMMRKEGFNITEGDRAKRLSQLGKEAYGYLMSNGFCEEGERVGGLEAGNTPVDVWDSFLGQFDVC